MIINESAFPLTVDNIASDLKRIGLSPGMTVIVHSSLKSFNRWIVGGPQAVILALEEAIGPGGTLVMPSHSGDLSDPANWRNPPVPSAWWDAIRKEMPAFDRELTPTSYIGILPECFRKQNGTLRSGHPQVSFSARGPQAVFITEHHPLDNGLGEASPLARLYDLDAHVLLLGAGHDSNTTLHLAEYRAAYAGKKQIASGAPYNVNGRREWVSFSNINIDSGDFDQLGSAFERETSHVTIGRIGEAAVRLMPVRPLVDFGVKWLERCRVAESAETLH